MPSRLRLRLAAAATALLACLLLSFALGQWAPGDAFTALELDPAVPPATLAHLRAVYLPQRPLLARFAAWLAAAVRGDWGYSLQFHRPVVSLLRERAPASLELILLGLGLAWCAGLLLALIPAWMGELARWRLRRGLELAFHGAASLLTALPLGVLAVGALVLAPASWLPGLGASSPWLPATVLALAFLPTVYFQAAHALAHVAARGFMTQGRAAGLSPLRLLCLHALPNTADVLVPVASLTLSQALVELVVLEPLLGWPGLGQLSIQAAQSRDMPVLAALVLISAVVVIVGNAVSEAVQLALNPRLRAAAPRRAAAAPGPGA
ncbi:MAG TPA: ABC transporter permease [Terriglobales bacterium]|nr:ABC transporter permease [Terriglobales bacterium]